jgi:hypothetical protein
VSAIAHFRGGEQRGAVIDVETRVETMPKTAPILTRTNRIASHENLSDYSARSSRLILKAPTASAPTIRLKAQSAPEDEFSSDLITSGDTPRTLMPALA